jgi:hypothetical protein
VSCPPPAVRRATRSPSFHLAGRPDGTARIRLRLCTVLGRYDAGVDGPPDHSLKKGSSHYTNKAKTLRWRADIYGNQKRQLSTRPHGDGARVRTGQGADSCGAPPRKFTCRFFMPDHTAPHRQTDPPPASCRSNHGDRSFVPEHLFSFHHWPAGQVVL